MLALATIHNRDEIAKDLIRAGADPNVTNSFDGNAPLHIAVEQGFKKIQDLLLEAGADESLENFYDLTPW